MGGLDLTWLLLKGVWSTRTPLSRVLIQTAFESEQLEASKLPWGPEPELSILCFHFHSVSKTVLSSLPLDGIWP